MTQEPNAVNAVAEVAASATAREVGLAKANQDQSCRKRRTKSTTTVEILDADTPRKIQLTGRDKWCFERLHEAGAIGCTTLSQPAPRWSAYVFRLRGFGLAIDTLYEAHGGEYSGVHGRYVLRSPVRVVEVQP